MAKLTPIQKNAMQWFTEGYTYIECDPRGYKPYKIQTIRSLIKKGYIEVDEPPYKLNDPYLATTAVKVLIPVPLDPKHYLARRSR